MARIGISSDGLRLKVPSGATGGDVTMSGELVIKGGPASAGEPDPTVHVDVGGTVGVNATVTAIPDVKASVVSIPPVSVGVTAIPDIKASVTTIPEIKASVTSVPAVSVGVTAIPAVNANVGGTATPIKIDLGSLKFQPGITITFFLFGIPFLPLLSMRIRGNASFGP